MKPTPDGASEDAAREPAWADGRTAVPVAETTSDEAAEPRWAADGPPPVPASGGGDEAAPERRRSPGGFRATGRARPFELEPEESTRSSLITSLGTGAVALLLVAVLLPSAAGSTFRGGWMDLGDIGGGSFLALLSLILVVGALALPIGRPARAVALSVFGGLICAFGLSLVTEDALREVYRGHPGVQAIVLGDFRLLLCACGGLLLPAALFGRSAGGSLLLPRLFGLLGLVSLLSLYLLLSVGEGGANGVEGLIAALRSPETYQGDRIAAWLLLGPLALTPSALLLFLPRDRTAPVAFLGLSFQVLVVGALAILALHVAKPSHWQDALPALKSVVLLGAGVLLAPAAVGEMAARPGRTRLPGTPRP